MLKSFVVPVLLAGLTAAAAAAQNAPKIEFPAASPPCKVEQRVGLTDVTISYARPSAKGRKIFGELVPHGEVWRTGANSNTTVTFSTPVKFGGRDVPAGTYSLHTIPGTAEWTVILNDAVDGWGSYAYDAKKDRARAVVKSATLAEPVETLEIGLQDLRDTSATLCIAWERTRVAVKLEVDVKGVLLPQIEAAMKGDGPKPYLQAAMFYYEHGLDLKQALAWMEAGIAERPDAFWMTYRKGLILEKLGDKAGAVAAAEQSLELARKAQGGIKDEYVRLNEALLARLRK
ncbi:MAG: DUF2911 domain-containing protein [Planctomycetes bacterium]|nr:DUF2911 domain-containing protein [Planctomycetota bacterium]